MASGNGIDFSGNGDGSGTMSSELLDDYEKALLNLHNWLPVTSLPLLISILKICKRVFFNKLLRLLDVPLSIHPMVRFRYFMYWWFTVCQ